MSGGRPVKAWRAIVLAASIAGAVAPLANAVEDVATLRYAGADRYATAAAAAAELYTEGAGEVVVVSGEAFPDSASAAPLAVHRDGPLLLTQRDRLPEVTRDAIRQLAPDRVTIVGGTSAISENVAEEIRAIVATVGRIAGADRFETSARVAVAIGPDGVAEVDGARRAIIGSGSAFGDVLAAGTLIAAREPGVVVEGTGVLPVLLVEAEHVPESIEQALTSLEIGHTIVVGGTGVMSAAVSDELEVRTGSRPTRLAGPDRYQTAVRVSEWVIAEGLSPADTVVLVNGLRFPDGLAAGVVAASSHGLVITTDGLVLEPEVENLLGANTSTISTILAVGGTSAVSDEVLRRAETSAEPGEND